MKKLILPFGLFFLADCLSAVQVTEDKINQINEESEKLIACKGDVLLGLNYFSSAIENALIGKGLQNIEFSPPDCYEGKTEVIDIEDIDDSEICAYRCGGSVQRCTVLQYDVIGEYSETVCLQIPQSTVFETSASGTCPDEEVGEGYIAVDLRNPGAEYNNSIPKGNYIITGNFDPKSNFPRICTYYND